MSMHEELTDTVLGGRVATIMGRAPTLTTAVIPAGVDDIEISGGFGPLAGQIWRVGLMGYSARLAVY